MPVLFSAMCQAGNPRTGYCIHDLGLKAEALNPDTGYCLKQVELASSAIIARALDLGL